MDTPDIKAAYEVIQQQEAIQAFLTNLEQATVDGTVIAALRLRDTSGGYSTLEILPVDLERSTNNSKLIFAQIRSAFNAELDTLAARLAALRGAK